MHSINELTTAVEKLQKEVSQLKEGIFNRNYEEISLHRACKILKRSPALLVQDIKAGRLQALIDGEKYRFTWAMIDDYQKKRTVNINREIRRRQLSRNEIAFDAQIRTIINNRGKL